MAPGRTKAVKGRARKPGIHDRYSRKLEDLSLRIARSHAVDLGQLLYTNMPHWTTHPDLAIVRDARNYTQNGYFLQTLLLPEHVGTHVDAPAHQRSEWADQTIDTFPVDVLIGPAKKINVAGLSLQPGDLVRFADFWRILQGQQLQINPGDIVIFEFGWDQYLDTADEEQPRGRNWWGANEPGLDEEICSYLSNLRVKAVGSDTPGCDIAQVDGEVRSAFGHDLYFLPRGILIVEGLHGLSRVPSSFFFIALPLNISGGSGSPVRPIALVPEAS